MHRRGRGGNSRDLDVSVSRGEQIADAALEVVFVHHTRMRESDVALPVYEQRERHVAQAVFLPHQVAQKSSRTTLPR